jgi:Uma2 family endonuclease
MDVYLLDERGRRDRHEYLDGHVYAMAGESEAHGTICVNLVAELRTQLRGGPCRVFTQNMKVRCGPYRSGNLEGLFAYPDLVVVCGARQYLDEVQDVLLNPTLLIEVLSPSTATFDRGEKFQRYRDWLPSLQDYVLVAQDQPSVEHFSRTILWNSQRLTDTNAVLELASITCHIPLREIYDGVTFLA